MITFIDERGSFFLHEKLTYKHSIDLSLAVNVPYM